MSGKSTRIREFIKAINLDPDNMEKNQPYKVNGFEIESFSEKEGIVWKPILNVIKKENSQKIILSTTSGHSFGCSPEHKVYVKSSGGESTYVEVACLLDNEENFQVFTKSGWEEFDLVLSEDTEIFDIEVADTNCYFSNGVLSHNTIFGDPEVPTGGTGPGFFSSVRIKLIGGSPVKDGDRIVGINVTAKTFKNRLSAPFREAEFQIIFGSGIDENDQLFDKLRDWCDKNNCVHKGKKIKIAGTGVWKTFTVSDTKTGEILIDKNFNKSKFLKEIRNNPEYKEYVDALMDSAFILSQEEIATLTGVDEFAGVPPTADEDGNEFHPAS
jgi:hypothetical protein